MMAAIGIFTASASLWGIAGATSTLSIFARDFILMIGVAALMYGLGIRDGIARLTDGEQPDDPIDADTSFTFPNRPDDTPLRIRHFGLMGMTFGVFMYLVLRPTHPEQATFWLAAFLLYGGTTIGFDLGIKRQKDDQTYTDNETTDDTDTE